MSATEEKKFVLKHIFDSISTIHNSFGNVEKHFGINWKISLFVGENIYLDCVWDRVGPWPTIDTNIELKIFKKTSQEIVRKNHIFTQETSPNVLLKNFKKGEMKNYMIDGKLNVEVSVRIRGTNGIKQKLRDFDESMKKFSDVVLIVDDEKFYVCKMFLASQSKYFEALLMGKFEESQQSEITLNDINPRNFQHFLEVLHGEPAIDDDTVFGILQLADMYDSKTAMKRCDEFLMNKSGKSLREKFEVAVKYKMDELKKKCISEMKTATDIRSVLPQDVKQMEQSEWAELLDRALSLM